MKGRNYFILALFLIFGFLLLDAKLNQKLMDLRGTAKNGPASSKLIANKSSEQSQNLSPRTLSSEVLKDPEVTEFVQKFEKETELVGVPTNNLEALDARLQQFSESLTEKQILYLKDLLFNLNQSGDSRAMAIELLSRSKNTMATEILKNFSTVSNSSLTGASRDQEIVFKAQAIEGISMQPEKNLAVKYLDEISQKTDSTFLNDRAQRARAHLIDGVGTLEQQDNQALKKLIR